MTLQSYSSLVLMNSYLPTWTWINAKSIRYVLLILRRLPNLTYLIVVEATASYPRYPVVYSLAQEG